MKISIADSEEEIRSSYPVMKQLRPHLSEADYVAQVRRQVKDGYRLAVLAHESVVSAAAGFRIGENLAWGKHLYVDDLVTDGNQRSRGFGLQLMEWLIQRARDAGCGELHLDSGVQRFEAHRFYLRHRMDITSHHFQLKLDS